MADPFKTEYGVQPSLYIGGLDPERDFKCFHGLADAPHALQNSSFESPEINCQRGAGQAPRDRFQGSFMISQPEKSLRPVTPAINVL